MKSGKLLFILIIIAAAFIGSFGEIGCANIIPPSGGPRDSLPPKLIKEIPADSTRNFSGNKITFLFDEYIDLQNVQTNLIVSPIPNKTPSVDSRLNMLTVKLNDPLEANTTYSLNFGNAIKDYNEGNVLKGYTYTFSTGPFIDSLLFSGKVLLAESGKIDSTLIVMLHKNRDDSTVMKNRPNYITRLDGNGNFIFRNLPAGTFYVYALQDQNGSHRYTDTTQLFAFADAPVTTQSQATPITLYAYAKKQNAIPPVTLINRSKIGTAERRLKYQTTLLNGKQDILEKFSFTFDVPLEKFDPSKIRLTTDSTFTSVKDYSWDKDSTSKKVQLNYQWNENTLYHILLEKDFAKDTLGRSLLKPDTLSFRTKEKSEYGTLNIHFHNLNLSLNPVLQLFQGNDLKKSIPLTTAEITEPLFLPGEYEFRILYDRNKNGKWDAGDFFGKHKQPEIVKPIERPYSIKPNINNEFDISL